LREIPEQVLYQIPAFFQAAPSRLSLDKRDGMAEELAALEKVTFSRTVAL
jgi:hypothetical protein